MLLKRLVLLLAKVMTKYGAIRVDYWVKGTEIACAYSHSFELSR